VRTLAQDVPLPQPSPQDGGSVLDDPPPVENFTDVLEIVQATLGELVASIAARLPLVLVGLVFVAIGFLAAKYVAGLTERGLVRTSADRTVVVLSSRFVRFLIVVLFLILAFAIAGVNVGAALATLGLAGLALAFALQNILENFVAGVLLLTRKPFRQGDQVRSGDFEGTVEEIDLRVTKLVSYDGELVLIPNADVFRNPITNLTRRARRRSILRIGIDYRDDHEQVREVLLRALDDVEGVLRIPEPRVELVELGESSVDFEILVWTLPDIASVRAVRDRVLSAAKTAVEEAGMTIPWPIRTLSFDNRLSVDGDPGTPGPPSDVSS
jgi:small conductance mechanosensitive channel